MAKAVRMGKDSVRNCLEFLTEARMISKIPKPGTTSDFMILDKSQWNLEALGVTLPKVNPTQGQPYLRSGGDPTQGQVPDPTQGHEVDPYKKIQETDPFIEQKQDSNPKSDLSAKKKEELTLTCQFGDFWNVTVRKDGRKKAEVQFRKALKKIKFEDLMKIWKKANIEFARKARDGEKQFIPHPATWLFNERWNDEGFSEALEPDFQEYTDANGYIITKNGYREPGCTVEFNGNPPNRPFNRGSLEKRSAENPVKYQAGHSPMESILEKAMAARAAKHDQSQG